MFCYCCYFARNFQRCEIRRTNKKIQENQKLPDGLRFEAYFW